MGRSIWLVILIFFSVFAGCKKNSSRQSQSSSHTILQSIPEKDREVLDSFFQFLLSKDTFAYTLFGKKPMSVTPYIQVTSGATGIIYQRGIYHPSDYFTLEKGWELWKNYGALFPSDEFVLKECKEDELVTIFLINKSQVLNTISENLNTFEEILDRQIRPQDFLQQLCDPHQDIMESLNDSSSLLGILLGYGKTNAMLFERKSNILTHLVEKMTPPFSSRHDVENLQPFGQYFVNRCKSRTFIQTIPICSPSPQYNSLADEFNDILSNEEGFELYGSDYLLDRFNSPVFMMRKEDPETKELEKAYFATKLQLHQIYQQGPFLEITLNQWMYPK